MKKMTSLLLAVLIVFHLGDTPLVNMNTSAELSQEESLDIGVTFQVLWDDLN